VSTSLVAVSGLELVLAQLADEAAPRRIAKGWRRLLKQVCSVRELPSVICCTAPCEA